MTADSALGITIMVNKDDFVRLENKVDQLVEALTKLVLFEERQTKMGERLGEIEKQAVLDSNNCSKKIEELSKEVTSIDKTVAKWTNLVMGGWAVISFLVMLGMAFFEAKR